MGTTVDWQDPENLQKLLTYSDEELQKAFPSHSLEGLKRTRRKYLTKVRDLKRKVSMSPEHSPNAEGNQETHQNDDRLNKLAELLERSGISFDDVERFSRVNVYQGFYKDAEGEAQTVDLISAQYVPKGKDVPENPFVREAAPVEIHSEPVEAPVRPYKLIAVFGDNQTGYRRIDDELVPLHDEAAMSVTRQIIKDLQPETIVNVGDCIDLAGEGKYDPDSNHFVNTLQASIDRVHRWYAELRADNPNARIVEVDSNHNVRLGKFVLKQAMQFYGLRRANAPEEWPILSYAALTRLDELGVEWVSGYPAAEFQYADDLIFIHGKEVRSNGSTAELYSKKYNDVNVVFGHVHRAERHTRTSRLGKYLTSITFGALARNDGVVPSYGNGIDDRGKPVHHQENWQQGMGLIYDYGDGQYQFDQILIQDGRALYNGKEYRATS